jgi:catechol 2,3-dioxygenase-like lactoylglutathione lyase family enzyme
MLLGIDHLVIAVPDLERAIEGYAALGFTVVPGGRHSAATHNALVAFADGSYLELLAFYEPAPEHRWWGPLQRGGGLVDFCCRTDDLPADTAAFRRAGVPMQGPAPLGRERPDGYRLRWVLSVPPPQARGLAPFLILDETPREERVPRERAHANRVEGIETVMVAIEDVGAARGWYEAVLGRPGEGCRREDLDAEGVRVAIGPHALELLAPRGRRGPLALWLGARGPSPYGAVLRAPGGQRGPLDPALAGGARLSLTAG